MKQYDIISWDSPTKQIIYKGRVNWCEDGEVGVTVIEPKDSRGDGTVIPECECKLLIEYVPKQTIKERIRSVSDDELEKAMERIRGNRIPKASRSKRGSSTPKKKEKGKLTPAMVLKMLKDNKK